MIKSKLKLVVSVFVLAIISIGMIAGCSVKSSNIEKVKCDGQIIYPKMVYLINGVDILKSNNEIYKENVTIDAKYYVSTSYIDNLYFDIKLPEKLLPDGIKSGYEMGTTYYYVESEGIYVHFKIGLAYKIVKKYPIKIRYIDDVAIMNYWHNSNIFIKDFEDFVEQKVSTGKDNLFVYYN